jgi:hypothetical protein
MNVFLRAKAWQLFFLLFCIPFALSFVLSVMSIAMKGNIFDFGVVSFINIMIVIVFIGWFWTIGTKLNAKVNQDIRMKSNLFRFALIYVAVYALIFHFVTPFFQSHQGLIFNIIPFHLFAIVCIFYGIYFVSKNIVMAERQQTVCLSDYIGEFFLVWFFPIGVWFIQPKINEMFKDEIAT